MSNIRLCDDGSITLCADGNIKLGCGGFPICPPTDFVANPPGGVTLTLSGISPCADATHRWHGDPNGSWSLPLESIEVVGVNRDIRYELHVPGIYTEEWNSYYGIWMPRCPAPSDSLLLHVHVGAIDAVVYMIEMFVTNLCGSPPTFAGWGGGCNGQQTQFPVANQTQPCTNNAGGGTGGTISIDWGNPLP